jgi:hypothetical protein
MYLNKNGKLEKITQHEYNIKFNNHSKIISLNLLYEKLCNTLTLY